MVQAIVEANHGPSIYDVLYSSDTANGGGGIPVKIDVMIDSILGNHLSKNTSKSTKISKSKDLNGTKDRPKVFNGNASFYDSLSSESDSKLRRSARHSSATGSSTTTSTDDEAPTPLPQKKKTPTRKSSIDQKRRPNLSVGSSAEKSNKNKSYSLDSSSEDDVKTRNLRGKSTKSPRSRTLRLMEKELDHTHFTDESDELVPIRNSSGYSIPTTGKNKRMEQACAIYSDSDSTDKDNKTDHTASDSQQQPLRTKAAMKEFNIEEYMKMQKPQDKTLPRIPTKSEKVEKLDKNDKLPDKKVAEKPKEKNSKAAKKPSPTDIVVVPQREAAKKASENLMKTNSALMIQSIASSQSNFDKIKRDSRSDDAEIVTTPKPYPSDTDIRVSKPISNTISFKTDDNIFQGSTSSRIADSDKKEKEPKRIKVLKDLKKPAPKVDTKADKKAELKKLEDKRQKEQKEKELEEKRQKELDERRLAERKLRTRKSLKGNKKRLKKNDWRRSEGKIANLKIVSEMQNRPMLWRMCHNGKQLKRRLSTSKVALAKISNLKPSIYLLSKKNLQKLHFPAPKRNQNFLVPVQTPVVHPAQVIPVHLAQTLKKRFRSQTKEAKSLRRVQNRRLTRFRPFLTRNRNPRPFNLAPLRPIATLAPVSVILRRDYLQKLPVLQNNAPRNNLQQCRPRSPSPKRRKRSNSHLDLPEELINEATYCHPMASLKRLQVISQELLSPVREIWLNCLTKERVMM